MNDLDRLINTIIPEYENSSYEEDDLFSIAKAALVEDIAEQQQNNPDYNIFIDHNPGWLARTAINRYIAICDIAFDKYPDDAIRIKELMEYNAQITLNHVNIQPPFDTEDLDRVSEIYQELETYYENSLHDVYRELGDNIRVIARIRARNNPEHSEEDYFNVGMKALHELSQQYSETDIMRHKPEAYINHCMEALANEKSAFAA